MHPLDENAPYELIVYAEQSPPEDDVRQIMHDGWPRFMLFDPAADRYWTRLHTYFPQFQFALYDDDYNVVAVCNSVPLAWDGRPESLSPCGWDWALETGVTGYESGQTPNTLSAISITVPPARQGQGISRWALAGLRQIARQNGLAALVAPVRPNLKSRYPLTPIQRYIAWAEADGAPFDPWIRMHWRVGACIASICPQSMTIPGSIDQWEEWAQMRFPDSGPYIVPGALCPVQMNVEDDLGCYIEPNVWMIHTLQAVFPGV